MNDDSTIDRPADARRQDDKTTRAQRPVSRHRRSSTKILKQWFTSHAAWPYPGQAEKEHLSHQTGMSVKQVTTWFVNARRRNGPKLASGGLSSSLPTLPSVTRSAPMTVPAPGGLRPGGHVGLDDLGSSQWNSMTPLDRWRHTPPEEEPVSLQAIAQAAQQNPDDLLLGIISSGSYAAPASWSSFDFSSSDGSCASSACCSSASGSDGFSNHDISSWRKKRRREAKSTRRHQARRNGNKDGDGRLYQCTFCTDTFKSRYDWTRHEGSLHLVLEKWTCLLLGPRHHDPAEDVARCVFCDDRDPTEAHLESHHAAKCMSKPLSARTFLRKDHLRQHLRLAHAVDEVTDSMGAWRSKEANIRSRCGFCGERFTTWPDRNDHLADHFRDGAHMRDWSGCRGFDPSVALLVENAMPPYLIGLETTDPEPFSASKGTTKKIAAPPGGEACEIQRIPTSFESLTARLGDHVRIARENSLDLSDEALRRQARLILYDDDDPWNQTPADNAQWLAMFKLGYGLDVHASGELSGPAQAGNTDLGAIEKNSCGRPSDPGPFTMERLQQAAGCDEAVFHHHLSSLPADGTTAIVPWSWQTPECLAEFSQLCQMPVPDPSCQVGNVSGCDMVPGLWEATQQGAGCDITGIGLSVDENSYGQEVTSLDDDLLDMTLLFDLDSGIV
ncbi:hypothetical protein NW767_015412 [Fusarium falciforme]|nr:hypothetical protein NW767_015412 [Fusarium falciforme]KAJ4212658.1 hypothetical protein NW757_014779 [Fusarium falciforme]